MFPIIVNLDIIYVYVHIFHSENFNVHFDRYFERMHNKPCNNDFFVYTVTSLMGKVAEHFLKCCYIFRQCQ